MLDRERAILRDHLLDPKGTAAQVELEVIGVEPQGREYCAITCRPPDYLIVSRVVFRWYLKKCQRKTRVREHKIPVREEKNRTAQSRVDISGDLDAPSHRGRKSYASAVG